MSSREMDGSMFLWQCHSVRHLRNDLAVARFSLLVCVRACVYVESRRRRAAVRQANTAAAAAAAAAAGHVYFKSMTTASVEEAR